MFKKTLFILFAAAVIAQPVFADDEDADDAGCAPIVKACLDAGYTRDKSSDKQFWSGCMKPLLMNKSVEGVDVSATMVKTCRAKKIDMMTKKIEMLKKANQ